VSATSTRRASRVNAGPTRLQRSDATRAALLQAASRAICEQGMQGASIDRIAAEAGYTKGAFYVHFASKEDMFLTLLDEHFAAELARLDGELTGAEEPVQEARRAGEGFLAHIDSDPQWRRLYQEFANHAARNDAFRAQFAARQRDLRARMASVFVRLAADLGVVPSLHAQDIAAMTFFMADGFLLNRTIDPELGNELYVAMLEVFVRGLMATAVAAQSPRSVSGSENQRRAGSA
jgi:AcrR family transcriptional regulator